MKSIKTTGRTWAKNVAKQVRIERKLGNNHRGCEI